MAISVAVKRDIQLFLFGQFSRRAADVIKRSNWGLCFGPNLHEDLRNLLQGLWKLLEGGIRVSGQHNQG